MDFEFLNCNNHSFLLRMQGNASGGESAQIAVQKANALVDAAWVFIEQKSLLPENPPSGSFFV